MFLARHNSIRRTQRDSINSHLIALRRMGLSDDPSLTRLSLALRSTDFDANDYELLQSLDLNNVNFKLTNYGGSQLCKSGDNQLETLRFQIR